MPAPMRTHLPQQASVITPQPFMDKDAKLWEGQLYLSHTSEIVSKLLYKKFYRNTDCTILYGKWTSILREQHKKYLENIGLDTSVASKPLSKSSDSVFKKHARRHSSPDDSLEEVTTLYRNLNHLSAPNNGTTTKMDPISEDASNTSLSPQSSDSFDMPNMNIASPPSPISADTTPQRPSLGTSGFSSLKRSRNSKFARSATLIPQFKRLSLDVDPVTADGASYLVASSRHGILSPRELEPFQCCVLFYTSSWTIPPKEAYQLRKVFGPELVPRIEAYISDKLNGEQAPGSAFIIETGLFPCQYIVCTSVARHASMLSPDYAYNAFRGALQAIYSFNRSHLDNQITAIICPTFESITSSPYNMVQQMVTCYEYWDWHVYAPGSVLPMVQADRDAIVREIQNTAPAIPKIAEDLEQYVWAGMLVARGLVYEIELQILLWWMEKSDKPTNKKLPGVTKSSLPKHIIAQVIVDIIKKPDTPPFTLTPVQIYSEISHGALEYIMELAVDGRIKIYEEIFLHEFKLKYTIAHGTSGKVALGEWNNLPVAIKFFNAYQPQTFRNELTLITLARHPKLVQAFGGHCSEKATYIVTELMDFNLYQMLQKHLNLDFITKLRIARDVAEGMEFLHSRGIIHRDLKSVNVLLKGGSSIVAKVCDFGLSRVADETVTMTGNIGTVAWIAPEIFQGKKYAEKCDVYSFGIVMFELITHTLPFKELSSFKIPQAVLKNQRPVVPNDLAATIPKDFLSLMKQCWHETPSKRPSFSQILLRLNALLPAEKPCTSFSSVATDDDMESSESDFDEGTSSSSSFSFSDQEQPLVEELKAALGTRRHSKLVTSELLAKCLLVRKGKVNHAKKLVKGYLEWYQILSNGKPIRVNDVRKTLEAKVLVLQPGATDKEGRPIIFWDAARYNVDTIAEPDLIRTLVYLLERATERADLHAKGIVIIGNFTGFSMSHFSTRVMNSFFGTLRKYFPVIINRMFFVNAPPWISRVITIHQSFVRSMINAIEITAAAKLLESISPEYLFPSVGGSFSFDMDSWIRTRYEVEGIEYL